MTIDEFRAVDLRVAKIIAAERVEGSEKLLKLQLDAGDKDADNQPLVRKVLSGIAKSYAPEQIIGMEVIIIANLEPRMMMGMESNGMLLAASGDDGVPVLLMPQKDVPPGSHVS